MKVSGFTIVRNAIKYDYPAVEAITSILPLCEEMIVAVGRSEDNTLELIRSINSPKIKIIETVWDDSLREGGKVLAVETDKALAGISPDSDWAFYIQADEVLHERFIPMVKQAMEKWKDDKGVEGLLFNYTHFYGSYDFIADSRKWYRKEIRVIKNDKTISSWKDAISFRKKRQKLNVKEVDVDIYHYGWVKPPVAQQEKQKSFHKMWHDDEWMKKNVSANNEFDYSGIDSLRKFFGTHPAVMEERIKNRNWKFDHDPSVKNLSLKGRLLYGFEKLTGWRIGEYKNYRKGDTWAWIFIAMAPIMLFVLCSRGIWVNDRISEDPVVILAHVDSLVKCGKRSSCYKISYEFNKISYKSQVTGWIYKMDVVNNDVVVLEICRTRPHLCRLVEKQAPDCVADTPDYTQTWKEFPTCD